MNPTTTILALAALAGTTLTGAVTAQNPPVMLEDPGSPITQDSLNSRAIRPGDIDGDGDIDLFVANFAQTNKVYRNWGDGTFVIVPPFKLNTYVDDSFDGAWGDMDDDGDLDLAVANGSQGLMPGGGVGKDNELWRNRGTPASIPEGRFDLITTGPVVSDKGETYAVEWVDLEGDGDLDLVFVNRLQTNLMYLNDGSGSFTKVTGTPFVTDPGTSRDLACGDLDNDGDTDLVVANSNGEPCFVYFNQGGTQGGTPGSFVRQTTGPVATDVGDAYGVSLADYDKDGRLDLFVSRRYGEQNMLYRNTGGGQWERKEALAPSLDFGDSYASAWGDLDRNGALDLLVANRDEQCFYYLGQNDGSFVKCSWGELGTAQGDSRDVAIADVDMDGLPDVLIANTLGGDDFYFRNRGRAWVDMGFAFHPGSSTPTLAGSGWLSPVSPMHYKVTAGPANRPAILFAGLTTAFIPFKGGVLVPSPDISIPGLVTDASGGFDFVSAYPAGTPGGITLYHQVWIQDPGSPTGLSATNGLSLLTP